jgi:hypothetical protein
MKLRRLLPPLVAVSIALGGCTAAATFDDGGTGGTTGGTGGSPDSGSSGGTTGAPDAGQVADAGPPAHLGDPCDPHAGTDSCATYGLVCDLINANCRWPTEFENCSADVGCADGSLHCVSWTLNNGASYHVCFQPCATTADCPTPYSFCQTSGPVAHYCDAAFCGPAAHGAPLFGACQVGSAGNGTCIPTLTTGLGYCFATGQVAAGGSCSERRTDGGAASFCDPQSTCVGLEGLGQFCEPLCSTSGSVTGPTCQPGSLCLPLGAGSIAGACFQNCASGNPCPTGTTCTALQWAGSLENVCLP